MSESHKHLTEEHKGKISEKNKGRKTWLGRHHTDETKRKISQSRKGKRTRLGYLNTPETKLKISLALKGRKDSDETRHKKRLGQLGRKIPPETIERIRITKRLNILKKQGFCRICKRQITKEEASQSDLKRGASWICKICEALRRREIKVRLRKQIIEAYGSQCQCCGERQVEFLTVDHIDGDGRKHEVEYRKETGKHLVLYLWLREHGFPKDRFRLLCYNCNCARGAYGYCPHQKEEKIISTASKILL